MAAARPPKPEPITTAVSWLDSEEGVVIGSAGSLSVGGWERGPCGAARRDSRVHGYPRDVVATCARAWRRRSRASAESGAFRSTKSATGRYHPEGYAPPASDTSDTSDTSDKRSASVLKSVRTLSARPNSAGR